MSIASKITSMTEHIGDIYDAVELTGIDTTGVNKNLVNVPNTLKDGFVDIINNGTDELYSNFPKTTGEGVEIALNNTFKAPMEIDLKGNTEQTTYTGKNLFDKNNLNTKNVYLDSSNKIIGTSSGNGTLYIPCEPNTTYTVSKTELFGDDRFCIFDTIDIPTINDYALSYEGLRSGYNNAMSLTITTSSNANYLCMFVKANTTSPAKTFEEIAETIQVEKNSTATSYEPYVGGTASPNPDYPQDIRVVKGNNTINIHGKNLFDKDNANILNASFATEKKLNSSADGRILWIACKGNTTYTISKISSTRFRILTTATTPNINVVGIDYVYGTTETSITITT
ncbi:hypothetical protein IKS57_03705, partial [bacterium]|nr:hypothetical protein [bacterium]